jgi:hypothetical protein
MGERDEKKECSRTTLLDLSAPGEKDEKQDAP